MRFKFLSLAFLAFSALGIETVASPTDTCTTAEYLNCQQACSISAGPTCAVTSATCASMGGSIACTCEMFCSYSGHGGGNPGGPRTLVVVPEPEW